MTSRNTRGWTSLSKTERVILRTESERKSTLKPTGVKITLQESLVIFLNAYIFYKTY